MTGMNIFSASFQCLFYKPVHCFGVTHVTFNDLVAEVFYFTFYFRQSIEATIISFSYFQSGIDIQVQVFAHSGTLVGCSLQVVFIISPQELICRHGIIAISKECLGKCGGCYQEKADEQQPVLLHSLNFLDRAFNVKMMTNVKM